MSVCVSVCVQREEGVLVAYVSEKLNISFL